MTTQPQFQIPPGAVESRGTMRDSRGAEALKYNSRELVTIDQDGNSSVFKEYEQVALGDGRVLPAFMLGSGKVELAICDLCRYPRRIGWFSKLEPPRLGVMARESGDFCAGCSQFVCRRHSRVVSGEPVRCLACASSFTLRGFIHAIFFAPVEDEK